MPTLPDGLVAVVKRDCPTGTLIEPVLVQIAQTGMPLTVYTQDDPSFPEGLTGVIDDTSLTMSWHHQMKTVPSVMLVKDGQIVERTEGCSRNHWESLSGISGLGSDLPEFRPGCGSLSVDPERADELRVRFMGGTLHSRRIELARLEDDIEAAFDRGWSDGLPVTPPTRPRAANARWHIEGA